AQFTCGLIDQQDRRAIRVRQFLGRLNDPVEQHRQIQRGVQLLADLHQALVARHQLKVIADSNIVDRRLLLWSHVLYTASKASAIWGKTFATSPRITTSATESI